MSTFIDSEGLAERWAREMVDTRGESIQDLVLIDKCTGTHVSHRDVGIGVSQVLPVLVSAYASRQQLLAIEQPEIHLHPRVQAELADLFVDAIRARESSTPRDCQFIIESHSEHFLRRLQRRIAEEELSADDAALYFVHTDGASARIEALKVDLFGNILNWPAGFFGDEMGDLVARSEAQARRMAPK